MMEGGSDKPGIERLIATYSAAFQIPENTNHYAPEDFEKAQRQFIRYCLQYGIPRATEDGLNGGGKEQEQ
jgi:hypothetical protein